MNKKQKGNMAEFMARLLLRLKGYHIISKNYVTGRGFGCGEIDIIASKRHTIVFIEVKDRCSITDALYAIKPMQQKRIIKAAELYLARHHIYQGFDVRFDAVFVSGFKIRHIQNAFNGDILNDI
ncbi:MAG: YraN family protein [Alphaproteobacteria bacterium]|nr:YraN family protein [Alphaproteobacteria bacterium]